MFVKVPRHDSSQVGRVLVQYEEKKYQNSLKTWQSNKLFLYTQFSCVTKNLNLNTKSALDKKIAEQDLTLKLENNRDLFFNYSI